ncbi:hypothetical protein P154DRAFT_529210 [Amniculicola lignicola CBS 123094]|uniref:Uncharacterized protein n=1 Tax=Amniculicola lignicola CBS 123094 TaxID=1392246 RepID=A0A6A5X411_9PLEO|nr:hypothetical protein P154DRAFT_529210 [Amniculicola lignicola CBS 123094]
MALQGDENGRHWSPSHALLAEAALAGRRTPPCWLQTPELRPSIILSTSLWKVESGAFGGVLAAYSCSSGSRWQAGSSMRWCPPLGVPSSARLYENGRRVNQADKDPYEGFCIFAKRGMREHIVRDERWISEEFFRDGSDFERWVRSGLPLHPANTMPPSLPIPEGLSFPQSLPSTSLSDPSVRAHVPSSMVGPNGKFEALSLGHSFISLIPFTFPPKRASTSSPGCLKGPHKKSGNPQATLLNATNRKRKTLVNNEIDKTKTFFGNPGNKNWSMAHVEGGENRNTAHDNGYKNRNEVDDEGDENRIAADNKTSEILGPSLQ